METLESRDVFSAGDLDASFGLSGVARIQNDPSAVKAIQKGGSFYVANGSAAVAKLTSQGALLTNYGNAGQAAASHELVAVQSTGAVVTAATEYGDQSLDVYFRRLTPAGGPDASFGTANGTIAVDTLSRLSNPGTAATAYDYVSDIEVDASDRVWALIHGDLSNSVGFYSDSFSGILRLTSAGKMDASFGASGMTVIEAPANTGFLATDLQLTSDGGAVIAGVYRAGGTSTAALYKVNPDGSLAVSFGVSGRALLAQLGGVSPFAKVVLTADPTTNGFYIAAYQDSQEGSYPLKLAKVTANGNSTTFGTGGVINVGNNESDSTLNSDGFAVAAQSDGKPLVIYGGPDWKLARFTNAGAVDPGFGANGVVNTSLGSGVGAYANPQSVLVQSDGMILVSGRYSPGGAVPTQSVLARYFAVDSTGAPQSSVAPLSAVTYQNDFTVSWSGVPAFGAQITGYDVYYQVAGGGPTLWQANIAATSAVFNVASARHKTIGFYSVARDNLGRIEAIPATVDASTNYIGEPWQNPVDRFDVNVGGADTGVIDPSDILFVIDEYNNHEISARSTSEVFLPPTKTFAKGRYVDVDGDNYITPSDILFVIQRYNALLRGEGESALEALADDLPGLLPPREQSAIDETSNPSNSSLLQLASLQRAIERKRMARPDL